MRLEFLRERWINRTWEERGETESLRARWLLISIKYSDHLTHFSECRNRPHLLSWGSLLYLGYNVL